MKKLALISSIFLICHGLSGQQAAKSVSWTTLDTGLFITDYLPPGDSVNGVITILKIDPAHYSFDLLSAKEPGEQSRTVEEWGEEKNLVAVINAGMYQQDHKTNVGYMKDFDFINNGHVNKNNAILAFNPKSSAKAPIQIIDRECQDWEVMKSQYNTFTQSIRMVDCHQKNCWSKQDKKWSTVAIGIDKKGNALFLFARHPYTVHDFINILLNAPIDLYNAMYLEGGPEASFYVNINDTVIAKVGSFETDFYESDDNTRFWRVPNVIGIREK
jgi:uncharacterized protein YigE (DUF2233 family)